MKCFDCGSEEHLSRDCPQKGKGKGGGTFVAATSPLPSSTEEWNTLTQSQDITRMIGGGVLDGFSSRNTALSGGSRTLGTFYAMAAQSQQNGQQLALTKTVTATSYMMSSIPEQPMPQDDGPEPASQLTHEGPGAEAASPMHGDSSPAHVRKGYVNQFNQTKGFVLIRPVVGHPDMFVHASHVEEGKDLCVGDRVLFTVSMNEEKGKPMATCVRIVGEKEFSDEPKEDPWLKGDPWGGYHPEAKEVTEHGSLDQLALKIAVQAGGKP